MRFLHNDNRRAFSVLFFFLKSEFNLKKKSYQGKSVKDAHKSFHITTIEYEIYKRLLLETLEEECKNKDTINEFLNLLDTIKIDVMGGKPPSLYEKMGGEEQINIFIDIFYTKIMNEKKIKHYFLNVESSKFKLHLKEFISFAMGGHGKK